MAHAVSSKVGRQYLVTTDSWTLTAILKPQQILTARDN